MNRSQNSYGNKQFQIAKAILSKKQQDIGGLIIPNFKTFYRATVNKTAWHGHTDTWTNRTESCPRQAWTHKISRLVKKKKKNGTEDTGHPQAKDRNSTQFLHSVQQKIKMYLKPKFEIWKFKTTGRKHGGSISTHWRRQPCSWIGLQSTGN